MDKKCHTVILSLQFSSFALDFCANVKFFYILWDTNLHREVKSHITILQSKLFLYFPNYLLSVEKAFIQTVIKDVHKHDLGFMEDREKEDLSTQKPVL